MRVQLTHLSLFSGIGGLDLAAEAAGFRTVGQCEFAEYPTKVLEKHWPDVPRWRDVRTLTKESFYERTGLRTVDIISGGFPCQPFPVAGKQKGKDDDRYLWPEMLRVIRELAPTWVIGENVPGILRLAAWQVVQDLEREGYNVVVLDFEAAAVGAPHRRERIAFVGHAEHNGSPRAKITGGAAEAGRNDAKRTNETVKLAGAGLRGDREAVDDTNSIRWSKIRQPLEERCYCNQKRAPESESEYGGTRFMADAGSAGLQGEQQHGTSDTREREQEPCGSTGKCGEAIPDAESQRSDRPEQCAEPAGRTRLTDRGWWAVEPDVGRVADGVSHRVDRLRCLGNAVVPQQFYPIFRAIAEIEGEDHDG